MNRVPDEGLTKIPGGTLITPTPEEGRALEFQTIAAANNYWRDRDG